VPRSQREGALSLGATRWQTIWSVVLPYARSGIVGGCFLALGRALGETMAVTMLIGNKTAINLSLFAHGNTIASVIANEFTEADYDLYLSALVELGLVLMAVTVLFSAAARLLIWRVGGARTGVGRRFPTGALFGPLLGAAPMLMILPALLTRAEGPQPIPSGTLLLLGACLVLTLGLFAWRTHRARAAGLPLWGSLVPGLCLGLALSAAVLGLGPAGGLDQAATTLYATAVNLVVLGTLVLLLSFVGEVVALRLSKVRLDRLMTAVLGLCLTATAGFLLLILSYLVVRGASSLNVAFFTELPRPVGQKGGGMGNALAGSAIMVGMATLFAVPVGLLAAIYLSEYRSGRLGSAVRFVGELLGGVPSIVIGIFGYYAVVLPLKTWTNNQVSFCAWAGAFALGVMMIPIVMRASEEALKLVPKTLREASYALGGSHWQTIMRVTVPAALPAIITAVFLSLARIVGETAPLMLTAGWGSFWPRSPNEPTPSLPYYVFAYAISAYPEWKRQAWAAALVLLGVVMLLNFGVRLLARRRVVQASEVD
jgi:phosphate transport system permease protein